VKSSDRVWEREGWMQSMLRWKTGWHARDKSHKVWRERKAEEDEQWRRDKEWS